MNMSTLEVFFAFLMLFSIIVFFLANAVALIFFIKEK